MILIVPSRKVDLAGLPGWFVRIYVALYCAAFACLLGAAVYALWSTL